MMRRLLWFVGALAGVVLAAGVTYAASSLSTQRIGLSSEPASALTIRIAAAKVVVIAVAFMMSRHRSQA